MTAKRIRRLLLPLTGPVPARTVRHYVAGLRAAMAPRKAFVHRSVQAATTLEVDFGESWVAGDQGRVGGPGPGRHRGVPGRVSAALNAAIITELEADLPTRHLDDGRSVAEALAQERRRLRAMPAHLPATCRVVPRVADKFGHVRVDKVTYSVPIRHAYPPVWVKLYHDRVAIAVSAEVVAHRSPAVLPSAVDRRTPRIRRSVHPAAVAPSNYRLRSWSTVTPCRRNARCRWPPRRTLEAMNKILVLPTDRDFCSQDDFNDATEQRRL